MQYSYRFDRVSPKNYQQAIAEAAATGWRLVQVLIEEPAVMPSEYVLVLERASGD